MSWRVFICSPNPPKNHQILIIQRMEAAQFAERNTEMIHQLQKKLVINQSIDKWLQLWTSPRLVFKHNQPTVEFVWVLVSVQTSQTKPVVKRRSNMTKSIHQGAFCCSKVLLQPVDSASFYTVHTVCVCTKPAAASLPVRGSSHTSSVKTRTMRLKDSLRLKDCCRLCRPARPLNSELWSLCSDFIEDWAGRGRARWRPTWTLKSGLHCCFSALFVSSALKDYSDLWQLGFHFCSFCNQHVNG